MNSNRVLIIVIILVLGGTAVVIQQYASIRQVEILEQAAFQRVKGLVFRAKNGKT